MVYMGDTPLTTFKTPLDAEKAIKGYERMYKAMGIYTPGYYLCCLRTLSNDLVGALELKSIEIAT